MAKSLRSKWKKKTRAIKRIRYGEKELERLKATLAIGHGSDVIMENLSQIATVTDPATVLAQSDSAALLRESEQMEIDSKRKYNKRTMRDENGSYPPWLNHRKIRKIAANNKKAKRSKGVAARKSKKRKQ